jgi:glutamate N-acetyltransferase/amino-acid N-acetyltransferase
LVSGLHADDFEAPARAIMTTDTFPKGAFEQVEIGGKTVTIAGIAKGSGMIAPDMATMLAYVFTDATGIAGRAAGDADRRDEGSSFNAITVDSDTSTSDTVLLAPPGDRMRCPSRRAAARRESVSGGPDAGDEGPRAADRARRRGCHEAGRGARHRRKSARDADKVARSIANSPLVKTAIAGEDPNWGRIVMAVGKSGAVADRDLLTIRFGDVLVAEKGWVAEAIRGGGRGLHEATGTVISVDLGLGDRIAATVWTCDLTSRYIEINADYRS